MSGFDVSKFRAFALHTYDPVKREAAQKGRLIVTNEKGEIIKDSWKGIGDDIQPPTGLISPEDKAHLDSFKVVAMSDARKNGKKQ